MVYLPSSLEEQLPLKQHPRLRIRGVIGNAEFAGAWQPTGGGWYLLVSKALLRRSGYRFGELAMVRFRIDDQNAVDVPEALQSALKADRAAKRLWDKITPGKRRGLAYYVSSAKLPATIDKRIEDVFFYLRHGQLPGKPPRTRAKLPPE